MRQIRTKTIVETKLRKKIYHWYVKTQFRRSSSQYSYSIKQLESEFTEIP